MAGYRETQEAIENVSAMKGDMDMMKGRTLEDISYMVKKLNQTIQEKKNNLSPIVKELRPLRQQASVSIMMLEEGVGVVVGVCATTSETTSFSEYNDADQGEEL